MSSLEEAGVIEGVEEEKKNENDDQHSVTETEKEEEEGVSSCDEGSEDVGFDDIKVE